MRRFELERAITQNELLLHYQPIVQVPTRRLLAVEALVRWRHPERGLVSPTEFIPEAEATGLIRQLTFWVIREALLQSNVWRRDRSSLAVAVNLSVDNLHDEHFRRFVELTLKVAGGPELLTVEASAGALAAMPSRRSRRCSSCARRRSASRSTILGRATPRSLNRCQRTS